MDGVSAMQVAGHAALLVQPRPPPPVRGHAMFLGGAAVRQTVATRVNIHPARSRRPCPQSSATGSAHWITPAPLAWRSHCASSRGGSGRVWT